MKLNKKELRKVVKNLITETKLEDLKTTFFHRGKQVYQLCLKREITGWELAGLFHSIDEARRMGKKLMGKNVAYPSLEDKNYVVDFKIKDLADQIVYEAK
jgi:hypothetical protein